MRLHRAGETRGRTTIRRRWEAMTPATRDTAVAVTTCLIGTALLVSGLYPFTPAATEAPLAWRFGLVLLLCAASLLRRRAPIAALLFGLIPLGVDLALGPTIPVWLIYSDLIYAAVLYARRERAWVVVVACGGLALLLIAATAVLTRDLRATAVAATLAFAFVATPVWWGSSVRQHQEIADTARARAAAQQRVAELDRMAAVADERRTMARDLHDVVAGQLSAIAIQSEAALGMLARGQADPALAGIVGSIREHSVDALREMRTMIGLLGRDDGGADDRTAPGGLEQLPRLVATVRAAGLAIALDDRRPAGALPAAVDQAAFRIAQEALTNAMKHAAGAPVRIELAADPAALRLLVRNPLPPGGPAPTGTTPRGLLNMRERAAALGGHLDAGPDGDHWEVRAELPLRTAAAAGIGR
ncbi:sensor histidine kinase [Nocardia sp. NPDC057353]|uniref:sensor histidine kinase n=1 Tax=Nocardia sp. NPDC057353 TaxID=3346104 RepID=UPI003626BC20